MAGFPASSSGRAGGGGRAGPGIPRCSRRGSGEGRGGGAGGHRTSRVVMEGLEKRALLAVDILPIKGLAGTALDFQTRVDWGHGTGLPTGVIAGANGMFTGNGSSTDTSPVA